MIEKKYVTVTTRETFEDMVRHVNEHDVIAFDTETNSLNPRKGSIIGFSVSGKEGVGYYMPTMVWNGEILANAEIAGKSSHDLAKFVMKKLEGKKIIAHNFSFDGRFVKNFYGVDLMPSLHCDTVLLAHTLNEEGPGFFFGKPFGLKEIAMAIQSEIGLDVKSSANEEQLKLKESIKKNGGSITKESYEIWKADLEILSEYAAADTDLTLRIYNHYCKQLDTEGLTQFFFEDEVMPLYKEVTIRMEESGVSLDMPLLENASKDIAKEMEKYAALVTQGLIQDVRVKRWIISRAKEEFPPTNKGQFVQRLIAHFDLDIPKSEKTGKYNVNNTQILSLPDHEVKPFLIDGRESQLSESIVNHICVSLWKETNDGQYFNIQSKDQLGQIVFDAMGFEPSSFTAKGKPQFDDDYIQELAKEHEWAKNLRIYNRLLKIKSTYIDRFLYGQEEGKYYPYYKQHATVSGRYGSDMQQLPRPKEEGEDDEVVIQYTNLVRAFLIPEEGNVFIDCDYESLEPHVFAHVSGDEGLKDIFRNNWDFYSTIAIKTEKLDQYSPDKKAENFLRKQAPAVRNKAKAYALGIPYGMGAYALGKNINVSTKEAKKLVDGYLNGFPELKKWMENSEKQAKIEGYVKTQVGRIRHLPKVKKIFDNIGDAILNWEIKKDLERKFGVAEVKSVSRDYVNGLNNAKNYQIQSLAASIVNRAAIAINRELKSKGIRGWVVAQVHDQLVVEVDHDYAEEVAKIVQDKMENTTKLSIALKAPPAIAKNMRDGH
jgi:DNA polymerase I-like protein with 3'-5' exonuclease and polymerase domains